MNREEIYAMADIAGVREEISIAGENKGKERPKNIIVRGARGCII